VDDSRNGYTPPAGFWRVAVFVRPILVRPARLVVEEDRVMTVRIGPALGLVAQAALLALVDAAADLRQLGWIIGVAYGVAVCFTLTSGLQRARLVALGPADWVTLSRAVLTGGILALVAESFFRPVSAPVLVTLSTVALILDWVDGRVARRTRTVSELGARFDMEVDAFLILVLSVYVARSMGAWVLAIGLMRYAFVAAGWMLRWMRGRLPERNWRKVVAASEGIVLTVGASTLLPMPLAIAAVVAALALLVESFGRDVMWLYRHAAPSAPDLVASGSLVPQTRQDQG
jgi:phosphatidylglycerophosphate synthase